MNTLLLIGDFTSATGFGRVNERLMAALDPGEWDIHVLAINASGDYHPLQRRYKIYPAMLGGRDLLGVERAPEVIAHVKPDLIVAHNDAWLTQHYLDAARRVLPDVPFVAYCPPDAPNQHAGKGLVRANLLLCPTEFGIRELRAGGYVGDAQVLPYGVDRSFFGEIDPIAERLKRGWPEHLLDAFVVGRADRNAPRKRYDLTLLYWKAWWESIGKPDDVLLYLHCAPRDVGWDLPQLVDYLGLESCVAFTKEDLTPVSLPPQEELQSIFRTWDVHLSTTMGEGFGLVALETAAAGCAQILPDWSAYGEIWKDAARLAAVDAHGITTQGINTIGGVAKEDDVCGHLTLLYELRDVTHDYKLKARARAAEPRFDWAHIGAEFRAICDRLMAHREEKAA